MKVRTHAGWCLKDYELNNDGLRYDRVLGIVVQDDFEDLDQ